MNALFDELEQTLAEHGPAVAIDRLCAALRESKEYDKLFYALLMKKRHELGVYPVPTDAAQFLPEAAQKSYEEAIREAGRVVGHLYLEEKELPRAWMYFRMLGEPEPLARALEDYRFEEEFSHIDVSHLGAIVQMSISLAPCPELAMARELCEYGRRQKPRFQYPGDPPFENHYHDYAVYLAIVAGERVEEGLAHFRAKVETNDLAQI